MKNPKEEAKHLVEKMFFAICDVMNERTLLTYYDEAIQCAIICVKEKLKAFPPTMLPDYYERQRKVLKELEKM